MHICNVAEMEGEETSQTHKDHVTQHRKTRSNILKQACKRKPETGILAHSSFYCSNKWYVIRGHLSLKSCPALYDIADKEENADGFVFESISWQESKFCVREEGFLRSNSSKLVVLVNSYHIVHGSALDTKLLYLLLSGLVLELNIQQQEYIGAFAEEAGVRIDISNQGEMSFPREKGLSAPPGFATSIGMRKVML